MTKRIRFITENCEEIILDYSCISHIEVNGEELLMKPGKEYLETLSLILYFKNPVWNYHCWSGESLDSTAALKRLKENDIAWVQLEDGNNKVSLQLIWETDAVLTSFQYTSLQRVVEYGNNFAFVHNSADIDMDFFFEGDE